MYLNTMENRKFSSVYMVMIPQSRDPSSSLVPYYVDACQVQSDAASGVPGINLLILFHDLFAWKNASCTPILFMSNVGNIYIGTLYSMSLCDVFE